MDGTPACARPRPAVITLENFGRIVPETAISHAVGYGLRTAMLACGAGRGPEAFRDGERTLVSVASPLSTGGAGTIYEYRVAAVVLAKLLRGDRVIGLEVPVTEVRLQQRIAVSHLDDVIAVADHPGAARLQVDIQVKRAVDPVPSDEEWKSVVGECLAALAADPDGVRNRDHLLAVAARAHAGHLEEVAELTRWARQHDDLASFTTVIDAPSGGPNAKVRNRWDHLRTTITNVLTEDREREKAPPPTDNEVKEAAFWIAHALYVWVVEAEADERDHRETLDRLGDLTLPDQQEAAGTVFLGLADIAQSGVPGLEGSRWRRSAPNSSARASCCRLTGGTRPTWPSWTGGPIVSSARPGTRWLVRCTCRGLSCSAGSPPRSASTSRCW